MLRQMSPPYDNVNFFRLNSLFLRARQKTQIFFQFFRNFTTFSFTTMAATAPEGKSWTEHNRRHKEKRKKWREERLLKKVKTEESETEQIVGKVEEMVQKSGKIEISTLSIAVPGSILDNAQSAELRTYLAGQIARAACIYRVNEVVVFDDQGEVTESERRKIRRDDDLGEGRVGCLQLARILQYLECPQYLRKYFFPLHRDLQYAGVLNPLDAPHHLRQADVCLFREGIVTSKPIRTGKGSQVNVGLLNDVHIDRVLTPGLRVTVHISPNQENPKRLQGTVVSPKAPWAEAGIYWGYTVRVASSLSEVFSRCPHERGYDLTIGTSDKGVPVDEVPSGSLKYNHGLVVFGGLAGLEAALDADSQLDVDDPTLVFDRYLNTCPGQGSRTIRTEEAVLVTLSELRSKLSPENLPVSVRQFEFLSEAPSAASNGKGDDSGKVYHSSSSEAEDV